MANKQMQSPEVLEIVIEHARDIMLRGRALPTTVYGGSERLQRKWPESAARFAERQHIRLADKIRIRRGKENNHVTIYVDGIDFGSGVFTHEYIENLLHQLNPTIGGVQMPLLLYRDLYQGTHDTGPWA